MSRVFAGDHPVLRFNSGQTQSHKSEQDGFHFIFKGAMLGIRNPKAHDRMVDMDEDRAFEYLAFCQLVDASP
jgi:uncharacterized protein (TIGR02391 family)